VPDNSPKSVLANMFPSIGRSSDASLENARALQLVVQILSTALIALATIIASEWLARGSFADIGEYMTSTSRAGMVAVGIVFLLLLFTDAIIGRAHQSAVFIVPLALLPAFFSGQKQLYLSDPLYPSDLLFGRQIMELLPVMVAAQPLTALAIGAATIAAVVVLATLIYKSRKLFARITMRSRIGRLAISLPILASSSR
jgi:phosphoglycerol transferase MdoB-like AlkP superfamily enzyme